MKISIFKILLPLFCLLLWQSASLGLNIIVIESTSIQATSNMDLKWKQVGESMGHQTTIQPQSTLDSEQFFELCDILIISSGEIDLPANRTATILSFIKSGKPVYIQCEHLEEFSTNIAFKSLVESLGGTFNWRLKFTGDLRGMRILGSFSDTHQNVKSLDYYWYSVSGKGDCRMVNFLEYNGEFHGFQYIPLNSEIGSIIATTDQDWVREGTSPDLLKNIITHLITSPIINSQGLDFSLGNDTTICYGDTLMLGVDSTYTSHLWQDGTSSSNYMVTMAGSYEVTVSDKCRIAKDTIHVLFISTPELENLSDTTACMGEEVILDASTHNGSYTWSDGSNQQTLTTSNPGAFWVDVNNGCGNQTFHFNVLIEDCTCSLLIPNMFSPNKDGQNDIILPSTNCDLSLFHISIYDRWGTLIYTSKDQYGGWDGTFNGSECPGGVYVYAMSYAYSSVTTTYLSGSITLIR